MPIFRTDVVVTGKNTTRDPLLNWSTLPDPGTGLSFSNEAGNQLGAAIDTTTKLAYLFARGSNSTTVRRSVDGGLNWELAPSACGANPVVAMSAQVDASGAFPSDVLAVENVGGTVTYSTDAGANWATSVALPSTGSWKRVRRNYEFNTVVVIGTNKIATSSGVGGFPTSFGSRTVPGAWSTKSASKILQPGPSDTGHGIMVLAPEGDTRRYLYTLDAINWAESGVHATTDGAVAHATWSEYHKAWFAVTDHGFVYRATTLSGTWTSVASFAWPSGSTSYQWIEAAGPLFVIHGARVGKTGAPVLGNFIITDLGTEHTVFKHEDDVWAYDVIKHDHRFFAATVTGGSSPYGLSVVVSRRMSFI